MNVGVFVGLLSLLGITQAIYETSQELMGPLLPEILFESSHLHKESLHRHARSIFSDMSKENQAKLEQLIIKSCTDNGHPNSADKLQPIFDEMKDCLRSRRIYFTPKEEFLTLFDDCSRAPIKEVKECLPPNKTYFPDLALALAKSMITFLYDDLNIIISDMIPCYHKLKDLGTLANFKQCIRDVSRKNQFPKGIPETEKEFCQRFVPTSYCFTNMVKEQCGNTIGLMKYREDYIKAHEVPCKTADDTF